MLSTNITDEDDDEEDGMDGQEQGSQPLSQSSSQASQQSLVPPLQPIMSIERQLSMGRNQLAPFLLTVRIALNSIFPKSLN